MVDVGHVFEIIGIFTVAILLVMGLGRVMFRIYTGKWPWE